MLPNIVFQIPQPSLIVIYQSLNIFPLREGHQIAVPSFMKADDSGKLYRPESEDTALLFICNGPLAQFVVWP